MSERKAKTELAKYLAYSNADEFIRGHGEEGHSFEDNELNESYNKVKLRVAIMLDKKARKHLIKYKSFGININSDIDTNY